uniref:Genome polyprotein n=1 Tax=Beeslyvirus sp. TaxID=3163421 RepID=A0AAU7SRN7_9VIRU
MLRIIVLNMASKIFSTLLGDDFGIPHSDFGNLGTGFLQDPDKEAPLGESDRVTSTGAGSSVLVDQSAVVPRVTPGQQDKKPADPSTNEPPVKSKILTDHFFRLGYKYWAPDDKSIHQGRKATMLFQLPVPQCFFQQIDTERQCFAPFALLQYYRYLRTGFEFVLQVNAQPFTEGQLLMYFEPTFSDGLLEADNVPPTFWKSLLTTFNFPHGFVNLFSNNSVRLSVPFTFFENAFDTMPFLDSGKHYNRCLGWLNVMVLNPLRTVKNASSDKVAVTLFGRMADAEFTGLRPWHTLNHWIASVKQNERSNDGLNIQPGQASMHMSNFEHTVKTHTLALEQQPMKLDTSSFGFAPTGDLIEFLKIPSLTTWTQWSDVWESGQLLFELPVTPRLELYAYPNFQTDLEVKQNVFTTNLSALSHLYAAWRGSINFHFQVVMSNFHRGRFAAFFVPGATFGDELPSLCKLQSSRFAVFDLGVESTFTFTVPFMDSRPYVNTSTYGRCDAPDPGVHTNSGAVFFHDAFTLVNCTGMLYVLVINKLQTTESVAKSIDINVYTSAGEDFQFFFPVEVDFVVEAKAPVLKNASDSEDSGQDDKKLAKVPDLAEKLRTEKSKKFDKVKKVNVSSFMPKPTPVAKPDARTNSKPKAAKVSEKPSVKVAKADTKVKSDVLAPQVEGTVGSIEDAQTGELGSTKDPTVIIAKDVLLKSSHTDVRKFLGRAHFYTNHQFTIDGGSGSRGDTQKRNLGKYMLRLTVPETGTLATLFSMHTFWRGPVTLHITAVRMQVPMNFYIAVLPPGVTCPNSTSQVVSAGATLWDGTVSSSVTLEVPFYVQTNGLLTTRSFLGLPESSPRSPTYLGNLMIYPVKFLDQDVSFDISLSFHHEFGLITKRPTPIMEVVLSQHPQHRVDVKRQARSVTDRAFDEPIEDGVEPWIKKSEIVSTVGVPKALEVSEDVNSEVKLVKRSRGLYDHYGIASGDRIYSMGGSPVKAVMTGHSTFESEKDDGNWKVLAEKSDPEMDEHLAGIEGEEFKYSLLNQNCEHMARFLYEGDSYSSQARSVKTVGAIAGGLAIGGAVCAGKIYHDHRREQSAMKEVFDKLKKFEKTADEVDDLVKKLNSYLDHAPSPGQISDLCKSVSMDLKSSMFQKIIGFVMKFSGYFVILLSNLNISSFIGVLLCLVGDVFGSVSNHVFSRTIDNIRKNLIMGKPQDDSLIEVAAGVTEALVEAPSGTICRKEVASCVKDFNSVMLAWKNVEWLFKRLYRLFQVCFEVICKKINLPCASLFSMYKDAFVDWTTDCQWCIDHEDIIKDDAEAKLKLKQVVMAGEQFLKFKFFWEKDDSKSAMLRWYWVQVKSLEIKLETHEPVSRPEPVVILLEGAPGQGKSLLSTYMAQDLCLLAKKNQDAEIYNKPPNAEFFDGYHGQYVHLIDDIGQDTEDQDWKDFTMLVSTCTFRPNMASLEDKGQPYSSKVVIMSTNFSDCSPTTVRSKDAIKRRIWKKIHVSAAKDYKVCGVLDMGRAVKTGALYSGECFELREDNYLGKLITLEDLVKMAHLEVQRRDFLHLTALEQRKKFQEDKYKEVDEKINHDTGQGLFDVEYTAKFGMTRIIKREENVNPYFENPVKKNSAWYELRKRIEERISKMSSMPVWLKCSLIAGSIFSIVGLGFAISTNRKLDKIKQEPEKEGPYTNTVAPTVTTKPAVKMDVKLVKEGANVETLEKVSRNMVKLKFVNQAGDERTMRGLFLGNDVVAYPQHLLERDSGTLFVEELNGVVLMDVVDGKPAGRFSYSINGQNVDVCVHHVPGLKNHKKKISSSFATLAELEQLPRRGALLHLKDDKVYCLQACKLEMCGDIHAEGDILSPRGVRYMCTTAKGFCGQPLAASYPSGFRVVSLHVAGSVGFYGYGIPIWKEIVDELIKTCSPQKEFAPGVQVVGRLEKPIYTPCKTKLSKTGIVASVRAPALMTDDAIIPSFSKYKKKRTGRVPGPEVTEYLENLYSEILGDADTLTYHEAIYGDGVGLAPLDHGSSAGYPYLLENKRKTDLYEDPAFQEAVFNTVEGEEPVLFTTFYKDELRPVEKVEQGKTRLIDASPAHFAVAFRMAYGHFVSRMHQNHGVKIHSMVGCDPEKDWTDLYWDLAGVGDYGLDLDYSGFDSSISKSMLEWAAHLIMRVTGIHKPGLFDYIINPKRVFKKWVYETDGGLPSGCPCTSILDTIINTGVILEACHLADPEVGLHNLWKMNRFVCYGDDVLLCSSVDSKLTAEHLVEVAEEFGMTMTSSHKDQAPGFVQLHGTQFLKRTFSFDDKNPLLIHPVIEENVIQDLFAWKRRGASLQDNLNQALQFAYHHGYDTYKKWFDLARVHASASELVTWEYLDRRWRSLFE